MKNQKKQQWEVSVEHIFTTLFNDTPKLVWLLTNTKIYMKRDFDVCDMYNKVWVIYIYRKRKTLIL